jgi:hypothetical protein
MSHPGRPGGRPRLLRRDHDAFVAMRADFDMRRRVHVQAWLLRQLVA